MNPEDLSFPQLKKFWKHAKEQQKLHTDIVKKGEFSVITTMCEQEADRRGLVLS